MRINADFIVYKIQLSYVKYVTNSEYFDSYFVIRNEKTIYKNLDNVDSTGEDESST